ncbi:MAG: hypothetical protein HOM11_17815 [Methylococcales bacterium]|jgi:hypothetical protein|nr:hypothetical protein [Methylococcales bacterium]MBT7442574.1 hypothetical protein [Methylococcales bacterium]
MAISDDEKGVITRLVMNLLDGWGAELSQQVILLGFPPETKPRELKQYHQGEALPDNAKILEHVRVLLAIDQALQMQYPHHKGMVNMWVKTKCRYFRKRMPLDIALERGLDGLYEIHRHLDCTQNWV